MKRAICIYLTVGRWACPLTSLGPFVNSVSQDCDATLTVTIKQGSIAKEESQDPNENVSKAIVYCRRRRQYNKNIKVRICITAEGASQGRTGEASCYSRCPLFSKSHDKMLLLRSGATNIIYKYLGTREPKIESLLDIFLFCWS